MTSSADEPKSQRRRRWIVGCSLAAVVALILAAGGYIWFTEHQAYYGDIASCFSDNMYMLRVGLEEYVQEHNGEMPVSFDELRKHVKTNHGGAYDICHAADKPYVWMPPNVKIGDGRPVILMCPPESHGWIRKYAFGLVRDDGTFRFVRVRNGRATRFRR